MELVSKDHTEITLKPYAARGENTFEARNEDTFGDEDMVMHLARDNIWVHKE